MKIGYCRVSTKGQAKDGNSLEAQKRAVKAAGAEKIYTDSFTGTTTSRPEFEKLLKKLEPGDELIVTKLDRFARSASQGISLVEELAKRDVTVNVLNMGVLDNSPTGKLIRNVFLCFAEFERDMIVTRTAEGRAIARQNPGYKEGRKPKFSEAQLQHALELKKTHSFSQVSELTGISMATLKREAAKEKAKDVRGKKKAIEK